MNIVENKKIWIIVAVSLLVGIIIGLVGSKCIARGDYRKSGYGMHMMQDGKMMKDGESMSMKEMMNDMNHALVGKSGDEFDKAFLEEMIVHHQGAIDMANLAVKNANHKEIKDLATAIITAQNKEIGDMQKWLTSWYK